MEGGGKNVIFQLTANRLEQINVKMYLGGTCEKGKSIRKKYLDVLCLVVFFSCTGLLYDSYGEYSVYAASAAKGWCSMGKNRYYYVNGKPAKGMKKIGSHTYYFSKTGVMQKNKWVQFGSYKRYFGSNGRMVKNRRVGLRTINKQGLYKIGIREQAEKLAKKWVNQALKQKKGTTTKLRACYNYLKNYRYTGTTLAFPSAATKYNGWDARYAKDFFSRRSGNCFSYSCGFAFMAKELGYKPKIVVGKAENENGAMNVHAWVEITGRVYDPEREYSIYHKGVFYGRTYGKMKLRYVKEYSISL